MFADHLRTKDSLIFLAPLFLCIFFLNSCSETSGSKEALRPFFKYTKTPADFDLGDTDKFKFSVLRFSANGKGKLLVIYEKAERESGKSIGKYINLSNDGGKSFGNEMAIKDLFKTDRAFDTESFRFDQIGVSLALVQKGNLFYSRSVDTLENFVEPVQINDEQGSLGRGYEILSSDGDNVSAVWLDNRRGFDLVFSSNSTDGGKTWSPNQAIEYDFRAGKQESPKLVGGANGRLLVFWQDWRDRKTLADIRFSYSDNQGKTWSPSKKINDDRQEVWQMSPTVVSKGSRIYVAFADFREKGGEDDNDWNIYFASSSDNGNSWEENKRLNGFSGGQDATPSLSIDDEGNLYCAWWTARTTLFGQIAFSYSSDGGEIWSPAVMLTPENEMKGEGELMTAFVSKDKLLARWVDLAGNKYRPEFSFIEKSPAQLDPVENSEKTASLDPIKIAAGEVLFSDDFSGGSAEKWKSEEGLWSVVDGSYMGSKPGSFHERFLSYAKFAEPDRYVIKGRFMLDPIAHLSANIYFRADPKGLRHYVVKNQFRKGTWLSVKNDDFPAGRNPIGGTPLVQKRFSFRQGRWYGFKLVVTPEQVDYYVNNQLMLSYNENLILEKERVGIGGDSKAPAYFDDISIAELKE